VTNSKGYSYNAAGLHPRTVEAAGISDDDIEQQSSMIKAFSSTRDPLTLGQENRGLIKASLVTAASQIPIFGPSLGIGLGLLLFGDPDTVPKAVGEQHKLTPPIPDELKKKSNLLDRVLEGHGMKSMIAGIEEQKTEDLKSLEKSLVT
ncbi:MAG TPA: hypothetical protein PKN44_15660, partial [Bacteroidales bacterium]|nr:hypothetical protein [Bacteroidales bacterium]